MTAIYVLTCPRPMEGDPWPYLPKTVDQIVAEALPNPHVLFVDGRRPSFPLAGEVNEDGSSIWQICEWERPRTSLAGGNKLPYWALLEHALDSGFDDVVVFEDDLQFCANAVRRMVSFPVPRDLALVQFFSPQINIAPHMYPGLWRPPATSFMFMQATKYTSRALRALVGWADNPDFQMYQEADKSMNIALTRLGLDYGVHTPDLVQHVGMRSAVQAIDQLGGRMSLCFPDQDFDALRLFDLDIKYR